jgi:hypothetical protein
MTSIPLLQFRIRIKYKVEVKGHLDETLKSATISQHLKIVIVKCETVNDKVLNILKFFGALNICKITTNFSYVYLSIYMYICFVYYHIYASNTTILS